jgi:hypothetical protein
MVSLMQPDSQTVHSIGMRVLVIFDILPSQSVRRNILTRSRRENISLSHTSPALRNLNGGKKKGCWKWGVESERIPSILPGQEPW